MKQTKYNSITELNNNKTALYMISIILFIILVFIDQFSKYWIINHLELHESIPIIHDIFEIHYLRNTGAAWGIFKDQQLFFCISTIIVFILGVLLFIRCVKLNRFKDIQFLIILILSGAIGNLIDRIRFHYVIDFLYFKWIDFPIFNIADCYVTIGVFIIIFLFIFKYKEEDIEYLIHFHQNN